MKSAKLPFSFTLGRWITHVRPAPLASFIKHLLRIRRHEITTAEGTFWVDPASDTGLRIATEGSYDRISVGFLRHLLKPGDTYLDIGANEGCLCVPASKLVGPNGRVIAIEPQTRLQEVLKRNFAFNGCKVEILSLAVTDHVGMESLHLTPDINNASTSLGTRTRYDLPSQSVPVTTLSELFTRLSIPDSVIVKMDIEGFEHEAILGSPELFQNRRIRALLMEFHAPYIQNRGLDPEAVPRFLTSCGYTHLPDSYGQVWMREQT